MLLLLVAAAALFPFMILLLAAAIGPICGAAHVPVGGRVPVGLGVPVGATAILVDVGGRFLAMVPHFEC